MTPEEVAVALSHIGVWKLIADSNVPYTLVLEDDIYFPRRFSRKIDEAWVALLERCPYPESVDLLYLSFKEAGDRSRIYQPSRPVGRPNGGLWQLSGYVLSARGARRLLDLLPARGPIDLWMNLHFNRLDVLTTRRPIIHQRPDVPSTNSYSVLPVLSKVGVLTRERPQLLKARPTRRPVFGVGDAEAGLTALASALSIIGYRCCSDVTELPADEHARLFEGSPSRQFDAYVNVGSLNESALARLGKIYRKARLVIAVPGTTPDVGQPTPSLRRLEDEAGSLGSRLSSLAPGRVLFLPVAHPDKWALLSTFLACEYPAVPYPDRNDLGQRYLGGPAGRNETARHSVRRLRFDRSPWIIPERDWTGIGVSDVRKPTLQPPITKTWNGKELLGDGAWLLRDDTFPSNLALFSQRNFALEKHTVAKLTLRREQTPVRAFTSAAVASSSSFSYGRFSVELRAPKVEGLITGVFLHRNRPRQEVDLEILGKDTTRILTNVYYNPGNEGTALEYGYRGTPAMIDLGFDASEEFHRYEIEWSPTAIRWYVDDRVVHTRLVWGPTPIPDLPMQLNINLWHSRSKELAGKLDDAALPAHLEVRTVRVARISPADFGPAQLAIERPQDKVAQVTDLTHD
jgi:hypothetical protein